VSPAPASQASSRLCQHPCSLSYSRACCRAVSSTGQTACGVSCCRISGNCLQQPSKSSPMPQVHTELGQITPTAIRSHLITQVEAQVLSKPQMRPAVINIHTPLPRTQVEPRLLPGHPAVYRFPLQFAYSFFHCQSTACSNDQCPQSANLVLHLRTVRSSGREAADQTDRSWDQSIRHVPASAPGHQTIQVGTAGTLAARSR
jgi:hypothetical protein